MGSTDRAAKLQLMTDSSFQDLQRFAMLAKAGVETPVRVEGYRRVFIQNESDSKTAARVASLTVIDKEAAEKGYFLGENVWDVPYTQQRLDEIVILSQQLALRSQVLEAEREEVTERLASERTRTALLRRLTIYSQSTAVVSALLAGDGFEVLKGEALMEVLDLSRTYLEATLPESRYERLRQGAQVRAKLVNSGTFLRRTIVCVLGPGAATSSSAGLPWVDIMITTYNEEWEVLEKWMPISFQCLGFCSVALASFPIRRVAVVQTPQSFLNYEPFRWNLGLERAIPDDGQAFYFDDQASRDAWGVSFFCGTSAILRRAALEEIGGIPEGCDTEDI